MDEDLQIVDVNELERESDEFNDVCKKKEGFNRLLCRNLLGMLVQSIADRHPRMIKFLNTLVLIVSQLLRELLL